MQSHHELAGDAILCSPGMPHEVETRVIDGRVQRVYKNLWPCLRDFWLWASAEYKHLTNVVYENERVTFADAYSGSLRAAAVFRTVYGIRKGDRVAICSRNVPEYLDAWWACHLLGAVAVLVNAYVRISHGGSVPCLTTRCAAGYPSIRFSIASHTPIASL